MQKPISRFSSAITLLMVLSCLLGCASGSRQILYPPANKLFVTTGDDPGSESQKTYTPRGYLVHTSVEWSPPLPIFGLLVFGKAEPQYVLNKKVLPQVLAMGGDAITGVQISHLPRTPALIRFFGLHLFFGGFVSSTTVVGQVSKR